MAQNTSTLVINADVGGATAGLQRLQREMAMSRNHVGDLSSSFNAMNLAIAGSSSTLGALRNLLNTLGLGIGIHQLAEYMDAWQNLNARLKLVTNSFQEFQTAQKGVFDIAQSTRQSLKETGDLYYKVADSTRSMGLSQQQVLQHTKAISQAIVISGSSAESAKAALVQYGQAMASNRLGGDELRSIAEQAPRLFRLIRENLSMVGGGFGATQAQFKALAADGYITTEKMVEAVNRGSKKLESEFSKLPLTIGQAWQLLENQMLKFVGSQGASTGMFTAIANGVKLLSENIGNLVNVLGIGVTSWAAYKTAMMGVNFVAWVSGIAAINTAQVAEITLRATNTASLAANTAAVVVNAEANVASAVTFTELLAARTFLNTATTVNTAVTEANVIAQAELKAATYTGAGAVAFMRNAFASLTATMLLNPYVAVATLIAGLATAAYAYRDSLISVGANQATLGSIIEASWLGVKEYITDKLDDIGKKWDSLGEKIKGSDWFQSIVESDSFFQLRMFMNDFKDFMNKYSIFGLAKSEQQRQSVTAYDVPNKESFETMQRAANIDQLKKLQAEQQAALDQVEKNAYAGSKATDLLESLKSDAGSLNNAETHSKKIADIYMKEIRINQIYTEEIKNNDALLIQEKKDHNAENEKLAQQAIDDAQKNIALTKSLVDQLIQKENDAIAQLNKKGDGIGNGKYAAEMAAKFKNLNPELEKFLENASLTKGVAPAITETLIAIESSFKMGQRNSESGAAGLMQVMPANYKKIGYSENDMLTDRAKSVEAGLSVWQVAWNHAKEKVKEGGNILDAALAYYSTKWASVDKAIINGVLNINLLPKATREYNEMAKEGIKQRDGIVNELEQVAQKELAQNKKLADEKQHLYENTAIGKYLTDMEQLNRLYDDKTSVTYQENAQKIADTFLKSAVDLNAYNEAIKQHKKLLDDVSDYNATISALQNSLATKEISKEKFSVGVTSANAKLMNDVTGTNIPASAVAEHQLAVREEQQTKAYENEIESWRKITREIGLSDDAAYRYQLTIKKTADGMREFSDAQIDSIMRERESAMSLKFADDLGLSAKKIGESFGTMFKDIALNGKSATQALGDMFSNMMNRITSTILDFIAQGLVQKMFSGFSGATGGLFSGLGGTVTALVGAVALGTYMGLQKHGSGIAATISQTSKYPNGVPADASLMLKTDAAVSDMVFLQTSKFADTYNKNLRDMLTSSFSVVRKNADSLGNFLNSTLNTYFPDFMQGLGELKTGISESFNGLVSGGKELIAKGTDALGVTTDAVQSLAEEKLNSVFDKVSGVAGKSMEKLFGTVAVIVSVGTEVYSLVKSWDGLKGIGNKLLAVTDSIGAIATTVAITFSNPIAAAVAGIATAISQVGALIKDGFTAQNIMRLAGGMIGAAIGTMILPGFGTLIGYVLGDTFGKLIGSLFQKQQKMYLGMDSLVAAKPYDNASLTSPKNITSDEGLAYTSKSKGREIIFGTTMGGVLFGQTQGINQPLNQDQKDYAQSVAQTVNGIGMLLNSLDKAIYGVTDKTNLLFRTNLHFEEKLDAKNFDSVKVMNSFFDDFLVRLETTGTESAKKVTDWIRVFTDAFSKEYKMAVIVALTQSNTGKDPILLELVKKPVEYMNYLDAQVKKLVNTGKTQEQIFTDVTDTMLKAGSALDVTLTVLSDMGIAAQDDYAYLIGMLNAMDSLGMSMYESANMVMILAKTVKNTFKNIGDLTGDALKNALRDQMTLITTDWNSFVTSAKLTGGQSAQAFQSSLNLMEVSQSLQLKDAEKLSVFGSIINEAAKVAANKDNAYKPVEDANTTLVKAQQSKSGIAEAQMAYDDALKKYNKDFETYLLKSGAEIVNNMMFMQNIYLATNKKITDSMTASDFISATNSFVDALGGIDKAMQITDKNMQLALGEKGALKWKVDTSTAALVTALNKTGQTMDGVVKAYLNDPLNAELAKTVALLGQAKDAQKAYNQSLTDSSKYLIDFSRSIKKWVDTIRATKIGTPTTQIDYAGKSFAAQLQIAQGIGASAEEKRAALSGITGYADTFIESIKSYYGSSEAGMKMIEQVVNDVSGLEKSIPIEQLQLGVLEDIKNGVNLLPAGLSEASAKIYGDLVAQIAKDKTSFDANPSVINTIKLDTDSKLVLSVINAKSAGANNEFIDALLGSFVGDKGMQAYLDFVINSTTFDAGEKLSKIDAAFKGISDRFSEVTSVEIKNAYELLQQDLINNPTELKFKNEAALYSITVTDRELTALRQADLLGKYVDLKLSEDPAIFSIAATGKTLNELLGLGMIASAKDLLVNNSFAIQNIEATNKGLIDLTKINTDRVIEIDTATAQTNVSNLTGKFTDLIGEANTAIALVAQLGGAQQAVIDATNAANTAIAAATAEKAHQDAIMANMIAANDPSINPSADFSGVSLSAITPKYDAPKYFPYDFQTTQSNLANYITPAEERLITPAYQSWLASDRKTNYPSLEDILGRNVFATGGAFTNGIVDRPTSFDMGLMGEAGSEGILPLHNINGSLGVKAIIPAANDSNTDNRETIAELKESNRQLAEQNRKLTALIQVMHDTLTENKKQAESLDALETKTRIQRKVANG